MITVFTPAYNRAHVLHRVYESLRTQTYRDFEWIIVDDGSSDHTGEVVKGFIEQDNFFQIRYLNQANQGKHRATNRAVREARGAFFVTIDSDDGCKPNALARLLEVWNTIPAEQQKWYKGVSCRCCKPDTPDEIIGTPLRGERLGTLVYLDSCDHDLRYKHKVKGELWGMTRREVMLENPYPEIENLHYFPEGVYWGKIGFKYRTRYFDEPLRYYYVDGNEKDNQLTKRINENETYYARAYMLSAQVLRRYFWYNPINFYMQAVGFVRDGLLTGKNVRQLLAVAGETRRGWALCAAGLLPGKLLQMRENRRRSALKRSNAAG